MKSLKDTRLKSKDEGGRDDGDGNESGKSEICPWMKLAFFLSMSKTIILRFNFVEISRILSSLVRMFGTGGASRISFECKEENKKNMK